MPNIFSWIFEPKWKRLVRAIENNKKNEHINLYAEVSREIDFSIKEMHRTYYVTRFYNADTAQYIKEKLIQDKVVLPHMIQIINNNIGCYIRIDWLKGEE